MDSCFAVGFDHVEGRGLGSEVAAAWQDSPLALGSVRPTVAGSWVGLC